MNRLAAILPANNVLVNVEATSKKRVFEHAGLLFENQHAIARATVSDNLFARERLGSTGLGHGVAIPHARIGGLEESRGAFLRFAQPVPFGAADNEPVDLVLALAVPEHYVQQHLHQLAELAEHFADPAFRERLRSAPDTGALATALLQSDPAPPPPGATP